MQRVIDAFNEWIANDGVIEVCRQVISSGNTFYANMPREVMHAGVKRVFQAVAVDMVQGEPEKVLLVLQAIGSQRSAEGAQISELLRGMEQGYQAVSAFMVQRFPDDLEARLFWETCRAKFSYGGAIVCSAAFLSQREQRVKAQAEEIMELSARVLPLSQGVLLLPLVGRIDTQRAERIMNVLLAAVQEQGARVVLFDVTALPTVDDEVAPHIVQAAAAVRLLGATAALVGVRPSLARTIVAGGIDLGGIVTLARLEDGLRFATKVVKQK